MIEKHTYPSNYPPGPEAHWALNKAWEILDVLTPGALSVDARALLSGMITGALVEAHKCGQEGRIPWREQAADRSEHSRRRP